MNFVNDKNIFIKKILIMKKNFYDRIRIKY